MSVKKSENYQELADALQVLKELNVPEHLQETALAHLLAAKSSSNVSNATARGAKQAPSQTTDTGDLRSFINSKGPKGAVAEIPALLYWAHKNEELEKATEKDVVELYRRAGMRPPKDVVQSFRDLCSKKYMRLEVPEGERGFVRLARAGEDFVLHDLGSK